MIALAKMTVAAFAVLAFYGLFYRVVVKRWGRVVQPLVDRLGLGSAHPVREVEAVGKLAAAAVAQLVFAVTLMLVLDVPPRDFMGRFRLDLVALGVVLGLAELAFSSFLVTVAIQLAVLRNAESQDESESAWLAQGRGGWMGQFYAATRAAPVWLAVSSVGLYLAVEEIVFRGILIEVFRPAGAAVAVGLPLTLFVAVQAFNMPNGRAALFPMMGAAVIGVVHGGVYWSVPNVTPLIVAHTAFFAGALLGFGHEHPARVSA